MEQLNIWYEQLHRCPELSRQEYRTADFITQQLFEMGLEVHRIDETAVIGVLKGGKEGKTVALRADMDALPITEQTGLSYASENQGVMHACGHDFHMSAALGAAQLLSSRRDNICGNIQFIFQPDEEGDGYAAILSKHPLLTDTAAVFGAHVDPALPAGTIGFKSGVFYASAAKFDIEYIGKSAHGAAPENGYDALAAAADSVGKLLALREGGEMPAMLSVGTLHSGKVRNVISDHATLSGILRSAHKTKREEIHNKILDILSDIEQKYKISTHLDFVEGYSGICNPVSTTAAAKAAATLLLGEKRIADIPAPLMTTEDFGEYLEGRDGCFYHIGVGGNEGLHSSRFAPSPTLLPDAAALHAHIIRSYLER